MTGRSPCPGSPQEAEAEVLKAPDRARADKLAPASVLKCCSASDEAEQLVAPVLHGLFVFGLHVQAEEGFGVRGAQVEPPVVQVDGEPVEVVYLYFFVSREVVFDPLQGLLLVPYF